MSDKTNQEEVTIENIIITKSGAYFCEKCAECFLNLDNEYDEDVVEVFKDGVGGNFYCENCGKIINPA